MIFKKVVYIFLAVMILSCCNGKKDKSLDVAAEINSTEFQKGDLQNESELVSAENTNIIEENKSFDAGLFYENGKLRRTLYVNSTDGLKIRDAEGLDSKRLCGVPFRMPLKVVAVGKSETIDNIKSNWVKVYIPAYLKTNQSSDYGWVFGGYLSDSLPEFSTNDWNNGTFEEYLMQCDWENFVFHPDHTVRGVNFGGEGIYGTWKADYDNKLFYITWYDPYENTPETTEQCRITDIKEDSFQLARADDTLHFEARFLLEVGYSAHEVNDFKFNDTEDYWAKYVNLRHIYFKGGEQIIKELKSMNAFNSENIKFLIENGVYSDEYKTDYDKYWDPIVKAMSSESEAVSPENFFIEEEINDTSGSEYYWATGGKLSYEYRNEAIVLRPCHYYTNGVKKAVKPGNIFKVKGISKYGVGVKDRIKYHRLTGSFDFESNDCEIDSINVGEFFNIEKGPDGHDYAVATSFAYEMYGYKDGDMPQEEMIKTIENWTAYEYKLSPKNLGAFFIDVTLHTSTELSFPSGFELNTRDLQKSVRGNFKLHYFLNMKNPVPIVTQHIFSGGMGGGWFNCTWYTVRGNQLEEIFSDGYLSVEVIDGTSWWNVSSDGILSSYFFQSGEGEDRNETIVYKQSDTDKYKFDFQRKYNSEPQIHTISGNRLAVGKYASCASNLRVRESASTNSAKLCTVPASTLVKILEIGRTETIGGIQSSWVIVEFVNDTEPLEGKDEAVKTGWLFAGFLE